MAVNNNGDVYVTGTAWRGGSSAWPDEYATLAYSRSGTPIWTNWYVYNYNQNNPNSADACAVLVDNGLGHVYVTGTTYGSFSPQGSFYAGYATIAYSFGGRAIWTNVDGGTSHYVVNDAVLDGNGELFITGSGYDSIDGFRSVGYSNSGSILWDRHYHASGYDLAKGIAVDNCGHVYVTGVSDENIHGDTGFATVAYSVEGVSLWTNRYFFNNYDGALAIAAGACANVYVAGFSTGIGTYQDYCTIAYTSAGASLWTNRYNGPGNSNDVAQAIAVGDGERVYVTGYSWGGASGYDYLTIAYTAGGIALWTNRYNGPGNSNDIAQAIAVDNRGTVYVAGYSWGGASGYDLATIAYSRDGIPLSTNRYNGPENGDDIMESRSCLAVGPDGAVYVAGTSTGKNRSADFPDAVYTIVKYLPWPGIQFTDVDLQPTGCQFTIFSPTNVAYRIEASTNLLNWVVLTNFSNPGVSAFQFTDTFASGFGRRFYRAVAIP